MEDKLHNYFDQNEFDIHEPHSGHSERFKRRLQGNKSQKNISWKWISVAASILLLIGFGLGNITKNETTYDLSKVSPKMAEAQSYFVSAIQFETQELEKNRNLDTEKIVESALDQIEELEDNYKIFVKELKKNGQQRKIINAMISNYQQRLEVLKNALNQIEIVKNSKNSQDEIFI